MKLNESLFEDYGNEENFINYVRDNFDVSSEYIRLLWNLIPYCLDKYGFEETKNLLKETVADSIGMDEEEVDAEFVIEESLNESDDDNEEYDKTDAKYYVVSYYGNSRRGREDVLYTDDFEEVKEWVWEKIQKGNYINVTDADNGNDINLNPSDYDFESDDAYRVFDDLDRISPLRSDSLHESKEGAKTNEV